jgi:transcriptional regulator with XRE-family HTH domain
MIQAHRLRQTRERRALSQEALGKLVAKDGAYISKIERGVLVSVNTTTLERLVHALHVSSDYLLGLSDAMGDPRPATNGAPPRQRARATNKTRTAPAPAATPAVLAPAAQPDPPRAPGMCPHCGVPMQPLGDGARVGCPGCRYSVTKPT